MRMLALLALILTSTAFAADTSFQTDRLLLGKPTAGDKTLMFRKGTSGTNPLVKYNNSTSTIQFCNNGTTCSDIGAAYPAGLKPTLITGDSSNFDSGTGAWTPYISQLGNANASLSYIGLNTLNANSTFYGGAYGNTIGMFCDLPNAAHNGSGPTADVVPTQGGGIILRITPDNPVTDTNGQVITAVGTTWNNYIASAPTSPSPSAVFSCDGNMHWFSGGVDAYTSLPNSGTGTTPSNVTFAQSTSAPISGRGSYLWSGTGIAPGVGSSLAFTLPMAPVEEYSLSFSYIFLNAGFSGAAPTMVATVYDADRGYNLASYQKLVATPSGAAEDITQANIHFSPFYYDPNNYSTHFKLVIQFIGSGSWTGVTFKMDDLRMERVPEAHIASYVLTQAADVTSVATGGIAAPNWNYGGNMYGSDIAKIGAIPPGKYLMTILYAWVGAAWNVGTESWIGTGNTITACQPTFLNVAITGTTSYFRDTCVVYISPSVSTSVVFHQTSGNTQTLSHSPTTMTLIRLSDF